MTEFGGKPVVYYDWNKGMDVHKDGIMICIQNEYVQIKDVEFYDPIRGFIQTKTTMYFPNELKKD